MEALIAIAAVSVVTVSGVVCLLKGHYATGGLAIAGPFGFLAAALALISCWWFVAALSYVLSPIIAPTAARPGSWWWTHRYTDARRVRLKTRLIPDTPVEVGGLDRSRPWLAAWAAVSGVLAVLSAMDPRDVTGLFYAVWFAASSLGSGWLVTKLRPRSRPIPLPRQGPWAAVGSAVRWLRHPHPLVGVLAVQAVVIGAAVAVLRSGL